MTTWSTEMEDFVISRNSSYSSSKLADAINTKFDAQVTRNAVIGKLNRLGLSKRKVVSSAVSAPKPRQRPSIERKSNHVMTSKLIPFTPKPEPVVVIDDSAPRTDLLTLFDLTSTSCRWPYGDGSTESPYLFCGQTVCDGNAANSYCRGHAIRAYTKPIPRIDAKPFYRARAA